MEKQMPRGPRELHKSRQALKALQTGSESPAALGRTNMKKSLVLLPCGKIKCEVPWRSVCLQWLGHEGSRTARSCPLLQVSLHPQSQPCPQVLFGTSCLVPARPHSSLCWFYSPCGSLPSGPGVLIVLGPTVGLDQK